MEKKRLFDSWLTHLKNQGAVLIIVRPVHRSACYYIKSTDEITCEVNEKAACLVICSFLNTIYRLNSVCWVRLYLVYVKIWLKRWEECWSDDNMFCKWMMLVFRSVILHWFCFPAQFNSQCTGSLCRLVTWHAYTE